MQFQQPNKQRQQSGEKKLENIKEKKLKSAAMFGLLKTKKYPVFSFKWSRNKFHFI